MNASEKSLLMMIFVVKQKENIVVDNETYRVYIDKQGNKYVEAKDNSFHMFFVKSNGFTAKWGRTFSEDPEFNPFGAEIADIEISKRCQGIRCENGTRKFCPWCYKSNTGVGDYMSFETFKHVFEIWNKPKTLTQIAFGTDASLLESANPDYWKIFDYCNQNGVTPNVTVADVDEDTALKMAKTFGACAVSYYPLINKNRCYDSVERIVNASKFIGKKMDVNIHALVSSETYDYLFELIEDYHKDKRLKGMNAIVFLSLKQKGRGIHFNKVTDEQFKKLVDKCFEKNVKMGFDSCSCNKFFKAIKDREDYEQLYAMSEPCESTMFSSYVDCHGMFYPCSFMEKEGNWKNGINVMKCKDFLKDIWYSENVKKWRSHALAKAKCNGGCTSCPYYDI